MQMRALAGRALNTHVSSMLTKTELIERRARWAADSALAMSEYLAEPEAVRHRTARLKVMRLEQEALQAAEALAAAVEKKTVKPRKSRKRVLATAAKPH